MAIFIHFKRYIFKTVLDIMQNSKVIFNTADTLSELLLCDICNESGFLIEIVFYLLSQNYLLHPNLYGNIAY
ncbi:hypothetical protein DVQ89_05420 [Yersinia enterocolitica]|nr:hypothetical protein [Yersinia enterocolitica]